MRSGNAIVLVAAIATLSSASYLLATTAQAEDNPESRGLVYAGLRRDSNGPCGRLYQLDARGLPPMCTHGPDPAPDGVDVHVARDTVELNGSTAGDETVPCIGDGVGGSRVQAVYAVASDRTDRYASIAPLIAGWAGRMDAAVNQSAAETGGERHIRFVTNADCSLSIANVVLSPTGDDSIGNTISELRNQGYGANGRKYLIWADATVYCGIAQVTSDDWHDSANAANTSTGYARVDSGCWGRTDHLSELHELFHNLGAVQPSAPHSSGGYHCTDESDVMCYQDAAGVTMTYPCSSSHEWLLDCGHDDYFNTAPTAGSYLEDHWNTADSAFLEVGSTSGGGTGTPTLALARTASPTAYSATGQTISYGYTVTNSGTATLGPAQFTVTDSRIGAGSPFACGAASTTLDPGATVTCSAATTVTQSDLDTGTITSSATASGVGVTSAAVTATVTASQTKALSLGRTASPTSYGTVGDTINVGYTVTNVGNVTLGPAQFTIADTKAGGGTPFACGTSTSLAPSAAVSCSATYTVTQADLDAGSLTSSATASGGGASSAVATLTVQKTTTTTAPTTKTSMLTGSVSNKRKKTFTLAVGDGSTVNALQFSVSGKNKTPSSLTLRVLAANGSVVAQTSGPSVVQLTTPALARGTYTWEVSGSTSASFTLQVTYAAP
jgi:hypothetical protein